MAEQADLEFNHLNGTQRFIMRCAAFHKIMPKQPIPLTAALELVRLYYGRERP